ncbi:MAG: TIGR00730 family Rossman fold protein [Bacteroidota bacterium]
MKSLAVFCGSKCGNNELYELHAKQLGKLMADHSIQLVYGGGNKGLMGAVANGVMDNGGMVIGVIPERLAEWDHHHKNLTELIVVTDMHTRKRKMYELCDVAVILPGGFGTMDEMFEMLTWNQLAIHDKPLVILNTAGYYTDLFQMMQVMHINGFLHEELNKRIRIYDNPDVLMEQLLKEYDSLKTPVPSFLENKSTS